MDATRAQEARAGAVRRVLARRRPPVTSMVPCGRGLGIEAIEYTRVEGSEFLPPASLGQWLDDRVAGQPWTGPFTPVLWAVAEAARAGGERAAVAELGAARRLRPWDQWHLYCSLLAWRDRAAMLPDASRLMAAVISAWEGTRGLAGERPREPELGELPDEPRPAQPAYPTRWGVPAGRLPWL